MVEPLLVQRVRERAHDMILARHLREVSRTILPRQDDVTHLRILGGGRGRRVVEVRVGTPIIRR